MCWQQWKGIHQGKIGAAVDLDIVSDLRALLLPANVLTAQKAAVVRDDRGGGRAAGAGESECTARIVLHPEIAPRFLWMEERMTFDAVETVGDEAAVAMMRLKHVPGPQRRPLLVSDLTKTLVQVRPGLFKCGLPLLPLQNTNADQTPPPGCASERREG